MAKPLYYICVYAEEQHGEPNQDFLTYLAVLDEPYWTDGEFGAVWNATKNHLRREGLSDQWPDIVDALRNAGFTIHDYSNAPVFLVEA